MFNKQSLIFPSLNPAEIPGTNQLEFDHSIYICLKLQVSGIYLKKKNVSNEKVSVFKNQLCTERENFIRER